MLAQLPRLEDLNLAGTGADVSALSALRHIPRLRNLTLSYPPGSDTTGFAPEVAIRFEEDEDFEEEFEDDFFDDEWE